MTKIKKKGVKGQCATYFSQKKAMRRLQLSLPNFRRLCILKGIYPTEPKNRKKVGKGNSEHRTYYFSKDISFLARETLIDTFRKLRSHQLKLKKAKERDDKEKFFRVRLNKPRYSLHAIVKERYPSIDDAIKDVSNSLNLLFVFARLPRLIQFNPALIQLSRRLCVEFLNYLISVRAIRKAFITIKGYFLEAEIMSIPVIWVIPHCSTAHTPTSIDFRLMATCLEFDATLVGSLLTHLYKQAGLSYPPRAARRLDIDASNQYCTSTQVPFEFLSSLTLPLKKNVSDAEICDDAELQELQAIDEQVTSCVQREVEKQKQMKLFEGKKVFLNRETPREVLCLIIHSCGGHCSYDASICPGSTFTENDKCDYQIVDRPLSEMRADRYYVQPQWVFDSLNAGRLLPAQDYLPGVSLPPHLSPFVGQANVTTDMTGLGGSNINLLQRGGLTGVAPGLGAGAKDYRPPEADYLAGLVTLSQIREKQFLGLNAKNGYAEVDDEMTGNEGYVAKPNTKRNKADAIISSVDEGDNAESDEDDEEEEEEEEEEAKDEQDDTEDNLSEFENVAHLANNKRGRRDAVAQGLSAKRLKAVEIKGKKSQKTANEICFNSNVKPNKKATNEKQINQQQNQNNSDKQVNKGKPQVIVRVGKGEHAVAREEKLREEANNERKMREMMMSKKHKRIYKKMTHAVKRRDKEIRDLKARRLAHDMR